MAKVTFIIDFYGFRHIFKTFFCVNSFNDSENYIFLPKEYILQDNSIRLSQQCLINFKGMSKSKIAFNR